MDSPGFFPVQFATTYPLWFVLLAWAAVLIPLYPGFVLCAAGLVLKWKKSPSANQTLLIGAVLLGCGAVFMALNWDSAMSGNPYHLFG